MHYQLLDTGNRQKLEQAGPYRLIRPALNAFWAPSLPDSEWKKADAVYRRDSSGGGAWQYRNRLPEQWSLEWGTYTLTVKPTGFGHLGFFAEQYANWAWFRQLIPTMGDAVRTLNLFGYSGVGSMAMAEAGARVTHLDAARGMIEWGQENQRSNPQVPDAIRWIVDDVNKFCARELRRGVKYNGIALDPPTFGRGSKGQVWKIEEDIRKLLEMCRDLLDLERPYFIVLSSHSPGFSPLVMGRLLQEILPDGVVENREMSIPESTGKVLPAGMASRLVGGKKMAFSLQN